MSTRLAHGRRRLATRPAPAGVAMIEALIGMLLIALWLLATAGLQLNSLKFQKGAGNRFLAVSLVGELAESMEANRAGANAGRYALAATASPTSSSTNCTLVHCTPTQLASYDLAQWTARVASTVPLKQVSVVAGSSGGLVTYTINLSWDEPRGRQQYATAGTTETLSYVLTKVVRDAGA
jgi:type IV pilus assembly protein PilV